MKNNQTTTEEILENTLKATGLNWLQIKAVKDVLAQEKKTLLEEVRKLLYKKTNEDGYEFYWLHISGFEALAHSQEDREGKEDNE